MIPPLPPDNSTSDPADPADPAVTISTTADFGHDPRQCDCAACQHIRLAAGDAPLTEYAEARFLRWLIEGADWPRMVFRRLLDGREFSI